jgi:hypothetical protein
MDMTDTIIPRSDQLNAEDLLTGPRTVTITEVKRASAEQPVAVHLQGLDGRPFMPCKSMRRVMVAAWGPDAGTYAGRRMTLYRDPSVRFGGMETGGIRISHLSHIDKPMTLALTITRGKRAPYVVKPLADDAPTAAPVPTYMADARAAKTIAEWREVWKRAKDAGHLTDALKAELVPLGEALKAKAEPVDEPPADFVGEQVER